MFFTRKFKPAKKKHKYGICIAARNEKYVIGNLLDSINKQDYPKELVTTFVVADNCTDSTADIASRQSGYFHFLNYISLTQSNAIDSNAVAGCYSEVILCITQRTVRLNKLVT